MNSFMVYITTADDQAERVLVDELPQKMADRIARNLLEEGLVATARVAEDG